MTVKEEIESFPEVAEAPRYSCAMGGAYSTTLGIYGAVPILHSGAGCGMANAHGLTFAAGLNTGGASGTTNTPCSCLVEEHVIFGGETKLRNLIKSSTELMNGDLFAVISGCVPALTGDDVAAVVQEFKNGDSTIIHVPTSGFSGNTYSGYETFFNSVIDQLLEGRPVDKKQVNIFGIVPYQHVFWKGDLQVIKKLLESIGFKANIIFTEFEGLEALKSIPAAALNLVFSPWLGINTVEKLKDKFGTPFEVVNAVPVGPLETTEFLRKVGGLLNVQKKKIEKVAEVEERNAYRFAEYMSEVFVISIPHSAFAVVADSATAISKIRYATNELGLNPRVVVLTDNPPEERREDIVKLLTEKLESAGKPQVFFEIDSHKIREILNSFTVQLLLASSLEKYIAGEELSAIHLSVAFPIYDRVIVDRTYAGYRGGLVLIEDIAAQYAGPL